MDESSSTSNGNGAEASEQALEQGSNGTGTGLTGTGMSLFGSSSLQKKSLFGMSAPAPLDLDTTAVAEQESSNKNGTAAESADEVSNGGNGNGQIEEKDPEAAEDPQAEQSEQREENADGSEGSGDKKDKDWFEEPQQPQAEQKNSDEVVPATQEITSPTQKVDQPAAAVQDVQEEEEMEEAKALLEDSQDEPEQEDGQEEDQIDEEKKLEQEEPMMVDTDIAETTAEIEKEDRKQGDEDETEDELEVDEKQSEDGEANKSAEKQPEEEEEAESPAQKTPPRRSTRGAAAATPQSVKVVSKQPTPKGTPAATKKSASASTTPASTRKSAIKAKTPVEEEEHKEEATSTRQTRRSATKATPISAKGTPQATPSATATPPKSTRSTRGKAAEEKQEEKKTPASTPATKKTPGRKPASAKDESTSSASVPVTPASGKKQPSSAKKTPASTKKEKDKKADGSAAGSSEEDPYSLDQAFDQHPEMLKNIHFDVKSFNEVKYSKVGNKSSEDSVSKYQQTEKTAEQRVATLGDLIPKARQSASLSDLTPGRRKSTITPSPRKSASAKQADSSMDDDEDAQPKRGRKKKAGEELESSSGSSAKRAKIEEPALEPPKLNAEEQWSVDHPGDEHAPHAPGARVFALYGKVYYPAIIVANRDGLGRFKVYFLEDQIVKPTPPASIIPLRALVADKTCLAVVDGDEMPQFVRILACPNAASAVEWEKSIFEVELENENEDESPEPKEVHWTKLTLDMHEWKEYIKLKSNEMTDIIAENISTTEDRNKRRSRTTAAASADVSQTSTPLAGARQTSKGSARKMTPSVAKSTTPSASNATPKTPAIQPQSSGKKRGRPFKKEVDSAEEEMQDEEMEVEQPSAKKSPNKHKESEKIFAGKMFILTSAMRSTANADPAAQANANTFKKKAMTEYILEQGGLVFDDFAQFDAHPQHCGFLISDMHYRTHKYLTALAKCVPCVSHKWINACREKKRLIDHLPYLLSAGVSIVDGKTYSLPSPDMCGQLLHDKKIFVHSTHLPINEKTMSFQQIWQPLVRLLGATVLDSIDAIETGPHSLDIMVTDNSATEEVRQKVQDAGAAVVSSEWLIQGIIMSTLPAFDAHPRFRYDGGNPVPVIQSSNAK
ncbi:hypothetical protein WR25_09337 [Diploscapter pachys]|uniref:BRCT domain-containing protein n=1 Tax=Diploscapter pachys TaxID=2018661 RepID=A0A2A2L5I6_9BILA|nr:hypothetical protein WR25_09337 [Diploscapter pachys]